MVNIARNAADALLMRPSLDQVRPWLESVPDAEIPVISVVDLGIVRDLRWDDAGQSNRLVVTVTPPYSSCPATSAIASDIETELRRGGVSAEWNPNLRPMDYRLDLGGGARPFVHQPGVPGTG